MKTLLKGALWLAVIVIPATAGAQTQMKTQMSSGSSQPMWYVSPSIGGTFAGDTTSNGTTVGVSIGWKSTGMWAAEAEFANTSNFFEQTGFLTDRRVSTVFGNVMVGVPAGGMRLKPYVLAGLGVVKPKLAEAGGLAVIDVKQPGFDIGGGVAGLVIEHVGFRADVRYLRSFGDSANDTNPFGLEVSKLNSVRLTAGLLVAF